MFLFGHLPYALNQMQYSNAGAGSWLPQNSPYVQQMNMPFSSVGTTVPQNYWNGMQFNMPGTPPIPKPTSVSAPVPSAPRVIQEYRPLPMATEFGNDDSGE